jgi:hypothetical protein
MVIDYALYIQIVNILMINMQNNNWSQIIISVYFVCQKFKKNEIVCTAENMVGL